MEPPSDNRTKSWLYRLRYLKMFKNSSNTSNDGAQTMGPSEVADDITFRRNIPTNSLDETAPELRKNESNLRKSFRKWHRRMKNCFSKNHRQIPQQQSIHIMHETPSPSFSPRSCSFSDMTPKDEVSSLAHHVWYWGPVSKSLVEAKLHGKPDGSFLVRDSASDRHIFSISFRSVGKTLHVRIEHTKRGYRVFDHEGFATVKELIKEAMRISSEENLFCYTKSRGEQPNYPVRLLNPISRYDEVRSLQNLSRFVIRQHINVNDIEKLSLPSTLISFLKEEHYF